MACTMVFICFWFSSLSGLPFKRLFSAGARSWSTFFSNSSHLSKTAWPQGLEQVAVKLQFEDWLLPLHHSDTEQNISWLSQLIFLLSDRSEMISPLMLLCWCHSPSPVCELSLPSVCAVASMPKAHRTPSPGEELILWRERCWTLCAAGTPGLARVCPGRLPLPVCVPSCWPETFPKPFGLLQELWISPPCSCRMGRFLC